MDQRLLEVRTVTDEITGHDADTAGAQLQREIMQPDRRVGVAGSGSQGIRLVAASGEGRVTSTVEDEIAPKDTVGDRAAAVERSFHREVWTKQHGRRDAGENLDIARRHEEPVAVAAVEHAAVKIGDRHAPE